MNDMSGARTWYNHTANVFLTPTEANFIQDSKANKGKRVRIEKLLCTFGSSIARFDSQLHFHLHIFSDERGVDSFGRDIWRCEVQ